MEDIMLELEKLFSGDYGQVLITKVRAGFEIEVDPDLSAAVGGNSSVKGTGVTLSSAIENAVLHATGISDVP